MMCLIHTLGWSVYFKEVNPAPFQTLRHKVKS